MSPRVSPRRKTARTARLAALIACAGTLWLGGCGKDPGQEALTQASITLASLNAGRGTPLPDQTTSAGYRQVIETLSPYTSEEGTLAADASLLVSAAQRGLGLHEASSTTNHLRLVHSRLPLIRAHLEAWKLHNAAAQAAAKYDPAPEYARIDESVRTKQAEAEHARATKETIDREIADLLADAASRMSQASALRAEAGKLQLQIPGVSETEGLALTEQIRELTRKADGLEFTARQIKARADRKAVDLKTTEVEIAKLESQIALLAKSRAAVKARHTVAEQRAAKARGDAQQAAGMIAALVDTATGSVPPGLAEVVADNQNALELSPEELFGHGPVALTPYITETFTPVIEKAVQQFETAASTARRASSLRRGAAQIALGEAKQSLGKVRWTHAQGLDAYAQLLEELAAATPSLPAAAEYASRAQDARADAVEAKQAAFEAYQDAKKAYEASGAKGDIKDRLEEVGARLNAISKVVGEGVMDADAMDALEEQPEPSIDDDTQPETPDTDGRPVATGDAETDLRAAIQAVVDAGNAGDIEAVIDFLHPVSDADIEMRDMQAHLLRAVTHLDNATRNAFGTPFTESLKGSTDPMLAQFSSMGNGVDTLDIDALDLRVNGDEAIGLTGNPMVPEVRFARIDGRWKQLIDIAAQTKDNPTMAMAIESMKSMLPTMSKVFTSLIEDVENGTLDSNAAVGEAFKAKLMAIMQEQMTGGG